MTLDATCTILLALTVLSVKHTVGDFFLQTPYQFANKGTYGHPGGLVHAGIHTLLTIPVFAVMPASSIMLGIGILAAEFMVHYHLDWSKEQLVKKFKLTQTDNWFWHLFGLDQLGHMLTYFAIVAVLAR